MATEPEHTSDRAQRREESRILYKQCLQSETGSLKNTFQRTPLWVLGAELWGHPKVTRERSTQESTYSSPEHDFTKTHCKTAETWKAVNHPNTWTLNGLEENTPDKIYFLTTFFPLGETRRKTFTLDLWPPKNWLAIVNIREAVGCVWHNFRICRCKE